MSSEQSIKENLTYRPVQIEDLELLLAWRSNPEVYEHFREQTAPLSWDDHLSWFASRETDRHDYVIGYKGRRVGSINLSPDSYVGVFIGEVDLWGEGIGSAAVEWICQRHSREEFYAEIHETNTQSRRLFEDCGFVDYDQSDEWMLYRRQE